MRISDWSSDVCSSDRLPSQGREQKLAASAAPTKDRSLVRLRHRPLSRLVGAARIGREQLHQIHTRLVRSLPQRHVVVVHQVLRAQQIVVVLAEARSEEHTSELQSLMRTSYAVFCLQNKSNRTP